MHPKPVTLTSRSRLACISLFFGSVSLTLRWLRSYECNTNHCILWIKKNDTKDNGQSNIWLADESEEDGTNIIIQDGMDTGSETPKVLLSAMNHWDQQRQKRILAIMTMMTSTMMHPKTKIHHAPYVSSTNGDHVRDIGSNLNAIWRNTARRRTRWRRRPRL